MTYSCECDYDAPSVFSATKIKAARKEHRCDECGISILPGEPYERTWGIWEGDQSTYVMCVLCSELLAWARISVPCFCWSFSQLHDSVGNMVDEVRHDVPGFYFEYGRRMVCIKRRREERMVA